MGSILGVVINFKVFFIKNKFYFNQSMNEGQNFEEYNLKMVNVSNLKNNDRSNVQGGQSYESLK